MKKILKALQDFRKFYGDDIPEKIIEGYENYLKDFENDSFKYDYETNRFVKIGLTLKRKKGGKK